MLIEFFIILLKKAWHTALCLRSSSSAFLQVLVNSRVAPRRGAELCRVWVRCFSAARNKLFNAGRSALSIFLRRDIVSARSRAAGSVTSARCRYLLRGAGVVGAVSHGDLTATRFHRRSIACRAICTCLLTSVSETAIVRGVAVGR